MRCAFECSHHECAKNLASGKRHFCDQKAQALELGRSEVLGLLDEW